MTSEKQDTKKSLTDRAKQLVEDVREALDSLIPRPEPQLIPIPIDRHSRPRPRRRY